MELFIVRSVDKGILIGRIRLRQILFRRIQLRGRRLNNII
jgi:hypothetical protein